MWKGRNFLFTLNEIEHWDELKAWIEKHPQLQYAIACLEKAPSTGHEHIHCYAQFKQVIKASKEATKNCRIDKCFGSAQANIEYVRKTKQPEKAGEIIWEHGEPKHKGGPTIKEIKEMPKEDREQLPGFYYNIVKQVNQEEAKDINVDEFHKEIKAYYIWGPSGIGKTKMAVKMIKEAGFSTFNLIKFDGNFWHGAKEQKGAALYDDFRDGHMKPSEFINLIDYNIQNMNVKGGSIKNRYSFIVITSVQDPQGIYGNVEGEPRRQWLRRFTEIIHLDEGQH